jgi:hypothetical protein
MGFFFSKIEKRVTPPTSPLLEPVSEKRDIPTLQLTSPIATPSGTPITPRSPNPETLLTVDNISEIDIQISRCANIIGVNDNQAKVGTPEVPLTAFFHPSQKNYFYYLRNTPYLP